MTFGALQKLHALLFERLHQKEITEEDYNREWDELLKLSGFTLEEYTRKVDQSW